MDRFCVKFAGCYRQRYLYIFSPFVGIRFYGLIYRFIVSFRTIVKYNSPPPSFYFSFQFKVKKGQNVPMTKTRGLGTDVAVISSMMFVAQIIISLSIGTLIAAIGTSAVIYSASFFSICAAIMATQVLYMDL